MPLSSELSRFLRHVQRTPLDPASLDDAADLMDELSDAELAVICRAEPGPRVNAYQRSLAYSCELRARLFDELADLELDLPDENAEGWIEKVLGKRKKVVGHLC